LLVQLNSVVTDLVAFSAGFRQFNAFPTESIVSDLNMPPKPKEMR